MNDTRITNYAIFDHPDDYPDSWVVREFYASAGGVEPGPAQTANSLEEARALLPEGVTKVSDHGIGDPPHLVEVWM
jgi:hypothetical protein